MCVEKTVPAAGIVLLLSFFPIVAQTVSSPETGISASLTATGGNYVISCTRPAWTFSGTLSRTLANVTTVTDRDSLGDFEELRFDYEQTVPMHGGIRVYQRLPLVLFTKTFGAAAAGQGTKFPSFSSYPKGLHVQGYAKRWGTYQFAMSDIENTSPAVFFDDSRNAFIISPASCFMDAEMTYAGSSITSGLQSYCANFPVGYTYTTALVVQPGINGAFDTWGNALTTLNGKIRPANDADVALEKCGYWTDNKATYYYSYDQSRGYEGTLLAVKKGFDDANIGLGYLQLDSWWYPKGPEKSWEKGTGSSDFANGCWEYRAHPELFPDGLADFKKRLGIPLVTHGRWFSNTSPYLSRYENSYTSSYGAVTDSGFWDETIGGYLKESGVAVYEQDWLDNFAKPKYALGLGDEFMTNMARGMAKHDITLQYCMVVPRHYLQASKYSNVTTMRISQDGFDLTDRDQIFYLSRVARSVGTYPWTDGFSSGDLSKLTVAVLTAGVVGFIDKIGGQNNGNILKAVRRDGVIIKPDVPITPTDETYVSHAASGGNGSTAPMVGVTYTDFGDTRTQYVFAYNRSGSSSFTFHPDRYGLSGTAVYAYDYRKGSGAVLSEGTTLDGSTSDWSYYIIAPIGASGIAFLGDKGKIASCGSKRITSLSNSANQVSTVVAIEPKETSVTLFGYANERPTAIAGENGSPGTLDYSTSSRLWSVAVQPKASNRTAVERIPVYIGFDPVAATAVAGSSPLQLQPHPVISSQKGQITVELPVPADFTVQVFSPQGKLMNTGRISRGNRWNSGSAVLAAGTCIVAVSTRHGTSVKKTILSR